MSDRTSYYSKISLRNKSPEEAERITKLFNDNINIAYKIASKYYKTDYWEYDEALQIAQMGLWKACLIWDPDKYRISTLAYNVINRDFIDFDKQQKRQPDILFNLEDNKARATSVFVILPMVITSGIFYYNSNYINWKTGALCAIGGVVGGYIGAKLLKKLPEKYLKIAFTLFLIYVSIKMITQ